MSGQARDLGVVQFEVLPFERVVREAAELSEPTRLTVTSSPRLTPEQTIDFASRLAALGHIVVPHLAARMVRDSAHLEQLLERLESAALQELFVIGGDNSPPVGEFDSSLQVLELVRARPHGVRTIGVAAYSEGHPLIDEQRLVGELERKNALADYMVTQMTFDAGALLEWLAETRSRGIGLPLLVGLPGVVDRRRLLEVSVRIGVGRSLRFVRKQSGLRNLVRRPAQITDELFDRLVPHAGDPRLGIQGFHYFTLNQLYDTWSWERNKHITHKEAENR